MFNRLEVLSSDTLNRDGYVIAFQALEQMVADTAMHGLPQLIDHDFHRPLGWTNPFSILIEPKLTRVIGNFYYGETEEELERIRPMISNHWQQINHEACEPHIAEFKTLLHLIFLKKADLLRKVL